jgi:hypothetical protein
MKITKEEVERRLVLARKRNEELKAKGILPPPTKEWSKDSLRNLQEALRSGKDKNYEGCISSGME